MGILHRNAIAVVDKITDFIAASLTLADNGAGTGSLNQNTTYYVAAIPGNRWGPTKIFTPDSIGTAAYGANDGSLRLTIAQGVGPNASVAEWYDLFLSTDAAPKWVARVTEAQRAAGDFEVTAVGTVAAGGGNPPGTIDVNVAGTGQQTSAANFAQSNAYVPNVAAGITSINCANFSKAYIYASLVVTDLRSAPSLSIVPFFYNTIGTEWHQGNLEVVNVLQALGQSLKQTFVLDVNGEDGLRILVDTIAGQAAAASIWYELV